MKQLEVFIMKQFEVFIRQFRLLVMQVIMTSICKNLPQFQLNCTLPDTKLELSILLE